MPGLRDTVKAITATFSTESASQDPSEPTPPDFLQLSQELLDTVAAFLEKYHNINEQDSQRLHDGLISIQEDYVSENKLKIGAFLQVLKLLQPNIKGRDRIAKWWDLVILPVLDGVGYRKSELESAADFILEVLENGAGEETEEERAQVSSHFVGLLLQAYFIRTKIPDLESEISVAQDESLARQLERVLISYGCKRPKNFLLSLGKLLLKRSSRLQTLGLLCGFVKQQPPHLYTVSQTPIIEHMIKCLMIDTSTTAVSLALTTLIMFLPHIPSSVRTHLPRLFLIYSRILCWERHSPSAASKLNQVISNDSDEGAESDGKEPDENEWEKLESSFESAESTAPELVHFFTFLYGLYPLNFTSYVHKPRKYLKKINFPNAENFDLDQTAIRKRTEQFRRVHLLHQNFFNTTLEDELNDDRWLKTDPADVVSECMGLSIVNPIHFEEHELDIQDIDVHTHDIPAHSLHSNDHHINRTDPMTTPQRFQSAPGTPSTMGSPITKPHDTHDDSSTTVPHFPQLPQKLVAVSPQLSSTTSQPSPRLGPASRAQMPRSPALRPSTAAEANMAYIQREIMLLRSDLNFERYLKQQHLSHIGQLQRRNIKEATVEAEVLNLLKTNRVLKSQLAKANESYHGLKRETHTERSQSKKWEAELSTKFRTLKEDEKKWQIKEEELCIELQRFKKDCNHLRQLVVDSESKELLARQELQFAAVKLEEIDLLKKQIQELEATIGTFRQREIAFDQAHDEKEELKREIERTNLLIEARDASAQRANKSCQKRITDLEAKLNIAQNPLAGKPPIPGQMAPQVHILIDSAVASIQAKYTALKNEYFSLRHQHVSLDTRCQELQDALDAATAQDTFDTYSTGDEDRRLAIPSSAPPHMTTMPIRTNKFRSTTASSNASGSSTPRETFSFAAAAASTSAPTQSSMLRVLGSKRALQRERRSGTASPSGASFVENSSSRRPTGAVAGPSSPGGRRGSEGKEREESDGAGKKQKKAGFGFGRG